MIHNDYRCQPSELPPACEDNMLTNSEMEGALLTKTTGLRGLHWWLLVAAGSAR